MIYWVRFVIPFSLRLRSQFEETAEGSGELAVKGDVIAKQELGRTSAVAGTAHGEENSNGSGSDAGVQERHVRSIAVFWAPQTRN